MLSQARFRSHVALGAIFSLALIVRWGIFYLYYFVYKTPGGIAPSPHANEVYDLLARGLLAGQGVAPWHFAYRPPLYPMFIALIYALFRTLDPLAAVFAQTFVSAAVCLFAYGLAHELGADPKVQLLAALLTALDPASSMIGLVLMAETLSNFFIALALLFLVRLLKTHQWRDVLACAASIVLAALARPNAVYFFALLIPLLMVGVPRWPARVGVFACVVALGLAPWYLRNQLYANNFTFATTGDFNLLFYKAVSVEQWATGKSPELIQAELTHQLDRRLGISRSPDSDDADSMWAYLVPADTRAYRVMREMAWEIYLAHPLVYLFLLPVTTVKLLGFSGPLTLDPFTVGFWLFNLGLYTAAGVGGLWRLRQKSWLWLAATVIPIAYFLLVPAVTGGVQDTRARTNVTVCFAVLAAEGLRWVGIRFARRGERLKVDAADDFS